MEHGLSGAHIAQQNSDGPVSHAIWDEIIQLQHVIDAYVITVEAFLCTFCPDLLISHP